MRMENAIISLQSGMGIEGLQTRNFSFFIEKEEVPSSTDPAYEQFLADVWVGIVLTLMVLSCVCCMCSCLLYHKFQQWKRSVLESRTTTADVEQGNPESESLPSYTVVSGLPSYEEALEQLKQVKDVKELTVVTIPSTSEVWVPHTPPTPMAQLSAVNLFHFYRNT